MYPSLSSVISQFRCHVIEITCDISKMFQGILLNPEERDYHRFLRRSLSGTIQDWRMKHLTFGVASPPYLATQLLYQAASNLREKYPLLLTPLFGHSMWMTASPGLHRGRCQNPQRATLLAAARNWTNSEEVEE